jgi:hypothetical protein
MGSQGKQLPVKPDEAEIFTVIIAFRRKNARGEHNNL